MKFTPYLVLVRGRGLAAVVSGVLFAAWGYVHEAGAPAYFMATASTLAIVLPPLFLLGMAGLYAWFAGRGARWEPMGLLLGCIGCAEGVARARGILP